MTFITVPVRTRDDIASAFEEFLRARVEAIYAPSSLMLRAEWQYFAERALAARLPTMCNAREIVEAGALMSYGTDLRGNYRCTQRFSVPGRFVARNFQMCWHLPRAGEPVQGAREPLEP